MTSLFQMASGAKQEKTEPDVNDYSKHYENLLIGVTGDDRDRFFKGIEKIHENDQLPGALPSLDDIYQTGLQVEAETTGPSWEGVGDIGWEVFKHLPQAGAAAAISRIQGISGVDVINPDIFERYQNRVRKEGQELVRYARERYKDKTIPFVPFVKITDLAELEQSIGFSMVAGAEGLVVGAAVMAATENPVLAYLAGMTETGASAYNMAGNAFMYEVLNYHNEEMNRLEGRNLLPEEQEILRDQAEYAAMQTGLWEAIPEAIGSGLGFGIINNILKKAFGPGLALRIAISLAGLYGEELVIETVTQMGQKSIAFEAAKEGLLSSEGREEVDFSSYGDWVKSLKEVAPAVFLLTTAMGGSTAVATKAYDSTIGNKRREAKMVDLVINATKTGQILSPVITDEVFDDFYMKSVDLAQKNPDNEELQASMKVIEQVATLRNNRTKPIEGSFEKFEENPFNEQNNDEIIDKTIQESKPEGVTEKGQAIIDQAFDEDMVKLQQLAEKVTSATLPLQYTPEELELVGNYPEQFEAKLKQAEAQLPKSEQASFDTAKTRNLNEKRKEKIEQEAREKAFDIELAINEGEMFDGVIEEVAIHPEVYNKISPFQKKEYDRLYAKLNKLNNEYKFLYRKGDALTKEGINRVNELEGDFTVEGLISKAQGKVGEYLKTLPKPPTASIKTQVKEIKEILQSEIEVHQRIYIDYIPGDWFLTGTPALNIKNEYYEGGLNPKFIKDEQEFERFKEFVIDDQKRLSAKRTAKLKSLLKELENKKNVTEKDIAKYKKELKESLKDSKRPDMRKLWAKYKGNLTDAQKSGFKTKRVGLKISADRTIKMISKDTIGTKPEETIVNELFQNSVDAIRETTIDGEIDIEFERGGHIVDEERPYVLSFTDNGIGMSPEDVEIRFLTVGEEGKSGTDTSGGYGFAKTAFLLWPDKIHLKTVKRLANGTYSVTEFTATPEEIKNGEVILKSKTIKQGEPHTTLELTLPKDLKEFRLRAQIKKYIEELRTDPIVINTKTVGLVKTSITKEFKDESFIFYPDTIDLGDGNILTIYYVKGTGGQSWGKWFIRSKTFNKGMPVYSTAAWKLGTYRYNPEFEAHIDFKQTAAPGSDNYPFLDNRKVINTPIVEKVAEHIKNKIQALDDAKFGKDIQAHIDMYNEAKEFSGLKLLIPYKDHSERRDANAIIERDKAVIVDIAKLFKRFRNILVNHGEKEIELGITVHMAVLGYRTNPDFIGTEMYAINPFALDVNTLKSSNFKKAIEAGIEANHLRANALVHVLIHEYAHNNVSDHYEAFTHEMFRLYMILGHELLASLAKDARAIYENHEEGFERISKSLESLGKSGTRFYAAGDATRNIWYAKRPKKDSRAKQKVSDEQEPTAKFLGYQVGVRGETVALYNVVGGRLNNSTVSANTLRKENIKVPETPDYEEKYTLQSRPNDKIISGIDIQKMFPGQTVGITNKNEHWVRFKNGQGIIVENVKYVESGAGIEMKVRHGKMQKKGPLASGSYKDGVIKLRKLHADTWTLAHESIHMLEDLGIITSAEISRIKRTIRRRVRKGLFSSDKRNEVGGPEDRANYIADILYKSDNSTGIQVIIDKVIDFLNQLVNYVTRTTPGIISDIKSGRIYDKAAKRGSILTPGSTPFYSKPAAMWYSKMRKELEQLLPKKSTPVSKIKEQILELSDPDRKGGAKFKREEVIFSGLLDMLDELTIMDETVIQVDKDGLKFAVADPYTDDTMMNTVDPLNYWGITAAQLSDFEQRKKQGVTTNKAEVLRYLEQTNLPMGEEWRGEGYSQSGKYPGTFYTLPGGTKYQEIVFLDPYVSGLKTGHFTGDNIIFHLRFDERIDDKNRRILFIQEIQSDHHQQAARLVKRFRKRLRILGFEKHEIDPMVPSGYKRPMGVQFNTLEQAKGAVYYDANQVVNFKSKKQGTLSARKSTGDLYLLAKNNQGWIVSGLDQKDSVNFSNLIPVRHAKTWPLQAMRRMIRYAVEQGSDDQGRRIAGIAWTTGKMQVERYTKHLQQNVDEIRWEKVVGPQSLSGPTKIMISRVYELPDGNWTIARGYAPHTETPTHYLTGNEQWSGNFEEAQYYETHTSAMEDLTRLQNIEPEQQHFYVLNTHTMENILADELMQADDGTTTVSTREEAERLRDEFLEAFPEETPANFEVHEVVFLGEELPAEEQGLYPEEQDPTYNTDLINYDDVEIVPISQIGYTSNYAINEGIIDKFILVIPSDIIEDSWDYLSETGDTAYDELQYAGLYDTLKEAKRALVKFRLKNKKIQRPNTIRITAFKDGREKFNEVLNIDKETKISNWADPVFLDEVIGEEIEQQIEESEELSGVIKGSHLRIGGQGMVNFYDKQLSWMVNKNFGKNRWGNVKTGFTEISEGVQPKPAQVNQFTHANAFQVQYENVLYWTISRVEPIVQEREYWRDDGWTTDQALARRFEGQQYAEAELNNLQGQIEDTGLQNAYVIDTNLQPPYIIARQDPTSDEIQYWSVNQWIYTPSEATAFNTNPAAENYLSILREQQIGEQPLNPEFENTTIEFDGNQDYYIFWDQAPGYYWTGDTWSTNEDAALMFPDYADAYAVRNQHPQTNMEWANNPIYSAQVIKRNDGYYIAGETELGAFRYYDIQNDNWNPDPFDRSFGSKKTAQEALAFVQVTQAPQPVVTSPITPDARVMWQTKTSSVINPPIFQLIDEAGNDVTDAYANITDLVRNNPIFFGLDKANPTHKVPFFEISEKMNKLATREGFPLYSYESGKARYDVKSPVRREFNAILRTIISKSPANLPHLTIMERLLKSPEWYNHPVMKSLVQYAIERSDIFHEYMSELNTNEIVDSPHDTVVEATTELRHEGLTKKQRLQGKTSPQYKQLLKVIEEGDTEWIRDEDISLEEQLQNFEEAQRESGVSDEVLKVWRMHRDTYDKALDKLLQPMKELINDLEEKAAFKGGSVSKADLPNFVTTYDQLGKRKVLSLKDAIKYMEGWKGFYAPRIRDEGNWVVQGVKNLEKVRYHRSSRLSAERLADKLRSQGFLTKDPFEKEEIPEEVYNTIQTANVQELITRAIDKGTEHTDTDLMMKFKEDLIREIADLIRVRGFRAGMVRRGEESVVKGYIEDPQERYVKYISNISAGLAKAETASKMVLELMDNLDSTKEPRVYQTAVKYIEEQMRNRDEVDKAIGLAKSVASLKYLGLPNIRSPFVNMTAILTTTPAAMHHYALDGKVPFRKIATALLKAGKDYAKWMTKGSTNRLSTEEIEILRSIQEKGYDTPQYTRDAMGTIQGAFGKTWTKVMNGSMYLFGATERWNRGTTLLASYRLARQLGKSKKKALAGAVDATGKAHGIYGKATLPSWAQGYNPLAKIGQMTYVYAKFGHNWLQMTYDLGVKQKDIKAFMWSIFAPLVLGGTAAVPLKGILAGFISVVMKALGDDRDPEKIVWDGVRDVGGNTVERGLRYGVTGLSGVDISGSLAIDPGVPDKLIELTGAIGGIVQDIDQAYALFRAGEPLRALETALPVGVGNILRSKREYEKGVTTRKGRRVFDRENKPYSPTLMETALRAAGFRSSKLATIQERRWEGKKEKKSFTERRSRIYEQYRAYVSGGTDEDYKEILKKVSDYNERVRSQNKQGSVPFITRASLKQQMKRMRRPIRSERLLDYN